MVLPQRIEARWVFAWGAMRRQLIQFPRQSPGMPSDFQISEMQLHMDGYLPGSQIICDRNDTIHECRRKDWRRSVLETSPWAPR